MAETKRFLSIPTANRVRYQRNFIKTAVCELRFPTLLGLEKEPPRSFQASVRKLFPFYEPQVIETEGAPDAVAREIRYLFRSKEKHWTVTVKSFAIALETSRYVDFEDFFERLTRVLDSAKAMIDSDFFTRVGFRYINWIPVEDGKLDGWIRPDLLPPIGEGPLGEIEKFGALTQGLLENGRYVFRQALNRNEDEGATEGNPKAPTYVLDTDYSKENVEYGEVLDLVKYFNEVNFSFFVWCLGDKAKAALGEGKPK